MSKLLKGAIALTIGIMFGHVSLAQTTFTTVPPLNAGNGQAAIAFNLETNQPITITEILCSIDLNTNNTTEIWYNASNPINGAAPDLTSTGWVQLQSSVVTGQWGTSLSVIPLTNPLTLMPGVYGFAIQQTTGSAINYTNGSGPISYTDGTVTFRVGQDEGYGGSYNFALNYHPRQFNGGITYMPATFAPNDAGVTAVLEPDVYCLGDLVDLSVNVRNFGTDQLDSCFIVWNAGTISDSGWYNVNLDTFNGTGPVDTNLVLGSYVLPAGLIDIEVYTRFPNGVADTVNGNDTATKLVQPSLNGIYTIDPAGAGMNNFLDITSAVAALNNSGVCGPVIFNIADGTYLEQIELDPITGASAVNTITFQSANGDPLNCVVDFSSPTAYSGPVRLSGGIAHVNFYDLKFYNDTTSTTFSNVVKFNGNADSISFVGCIFENEITSSTSVNASLVHKDNVKSVDVVFDSCTFLKGSHGIYWDGISSNYDDRTVVTNSVFQDQYDVGAYFYYQDEPTVVNNRITSTSTYTTGYGMWLYNFTGADIKVKNNHVYQTGSTAWPRDGMYMVNWVGDLNQRADVSGNVVSMPNGGRYGVYMSNDLFIDFANNSVLFDDASASDEAVYITGGAVNRFYNNAVEAGGSAITMFVSGSAVDMSDNNAFTGNTGFSWNGTHPDLTSLVAATNMDSNSVMLSTIFTDSMALLVCNDTLNAAGMDNPYYLADMQGDPTVAGAYDIGADQFETANTFDIRDTVGLCSGGTVTLEAWYFDTIVWNGADTGNTYQTSLLGAVTVNASGLCGTASDTVHVVPAVDVDLPATSVICLANTATIDAGIANATYSWSTGEATQSIQITSPGTYSVTVTDQDGCVSDDQTVANVNIPVDLTEEEILCEGGSVTLDAGIAGGSYSWSTGDATQTISVNTPGDVIVTVTDADGCISQDSTVVVEVQFPAADFSSATLMYGVTFTNNSSDGEDYLWLFGDGDSSTLENPSHVYPWTNQDTSVFTVTLITSNACGSDTTVQEVLVGNLVSVQEIAGSGSMKVFPNPASDAVWLDFTKIETQSAAVNVMITDIQGKVVLDREIGMTGGGQVEQLDISNLVSGVYIIAVSNDEFSFNHQLVVQ